MSLTQKLLNDKSVDSKSAYIFTCTNDVWLQQAKLTAQDVEADDWFGSSVAISFDGSTAIIGACLDDDKGTDSGSAYIFIRNGDKWLQQAKLTAQDGAIYDQFGFSVAISSDGNTAIVGARGSDTDKGINSGSAYIFVRDDNVWSQQAKLTASDGQTNDEFGYSVAISSDGNTAIIGASYDDNKGNYSGSAYIFIRKGDTWIQQAKLIAEDGAANNWFGYSVAISSNGNTAVIGARGNDNYKGSAYIFTCSNGIWIQQAKLVATDGTTGNEFGSSVAISFDGSTVIVGARYGDTNKGKNSGSAYIFTYSNGVWTQQVKLLAQDGKANERFGSSVAISSDGNTAIVGTYEYYNNSCSAYIFTRNGNTWIQQTKLLSSNKESYNSYGIIVAISSDGNTAIVGARGVTDYKGSVYIFTRSSNTQTEQTKLFALDGGTYDWFGRSVAISSNSKTAIIGASGDDDKGTDSGSAYIFTCINGVWLQQAKLVAADGAAGDEFGFSVAISSDGNTVIVGAYLDDNYKGSAYVFTRNGNVWLQQAKLVASDEEANDYFGISVAISSDGKTAIIGAPYDNKGDTSGSAYVFTYTGNTWTQQTKLVAGDKELNDWFGSSVAISGDGNTAVIGARGNNKYKGSAYIFIRNGNTWIQQAKLVASDREINDWFGRSVAISSDGNTVIVGACLDDTDKGIDSGSAYVFVHNGDEWLQQAKLTAQDGAGYDWFGFSVAISSDGNSAVIGAYGDDGNRGSAYVFTRSGDIWTQQAKLIASDETAGDNFGWSVAIYSDGSAVLVGANYNSNKSDYAGSVYLFTRNSDI